MTQPELVTLIRALMDLAITVILFAGVWAIWKTLTGGFGKGKQK
jgi:hypothetical protein